MANSETKEETWTMPEPQHEHQWLQKLVGEWTYESETTMEPGKPAERTAGRESVRSLGQLWVLAEGETNLNDGGTHSSVMTLGFDPEKQRFAGSFISSMMTYFWVYDGELDAPGRTLTLFTEGPGMSLDAPMAKYRETIELAGDDDRVFTSSIRGEDGQWQEFMRSNYRRTE